MSDAVQSPVPGFATVGEAAEFLALSRAMIRKLIGSRLIPARRFGRSVRIPWSWLHGQTQRQRVD